VLDASALLALLQREPGAERVVVAITAGAAISTVNLAEVAGKLTEAGMSAEATMAAIESLELDIVAFDQPLAIRTGSLRPMTRALGLSLGDRACVALAEQLGLPILTSDRTWVDAVPGLEVRLIR
jgi:PIN domain nuclease of toxin-antitoxin system